MRFVKESRIAAPPSAVFAFHETPGALSLLTPPWEKVEVVEGGGSIRPGSRVILKTKIGPLSLRWVAEHTEYEQGRLFADRQVSGPFAEWSHRHLFLDDGAGGCLMRDEVEYEPPLGLLGRMLGADLHPEEAARPVRLSPRGRPPDHRGGTTSPPTSRPSDRPEATPCGMDSPSPGDVRSLHESHGTIESAIRGHFGEFCLFSEISSRLARFERVP